MPDDSLRSKTKGVLEWVEHGYFVASLIVAAASGTTMRAVLSAYTHLSPIWITPIWLAVSAAAVGLLVFLGNVYQQRHAHRSLTSTVGPGTPSWREAFIHPRWQIVDNYKFENDSIVVDGKSFRRCSFKNVKFLFHGTAPFEFQGPNDIDAGSILFGTDDPAIRWYETIQEQFAALPGAKLETTAKDAAGHDIVRKKPTVERIGRSRDGNDEKASEAVPPHVIVVKIEHPERGMTPETSITLKNVGKEVVQNVGLKPFTLSDKEVSFTQVAIISIDEEKSVSPRIKGVVVLQQRDLLSVLESEWANTDVSKKEFLVRTEVRFENLSGKSFEVPFDLVYCAQIHRLYKMTQNERAKSQYVLLEARNFGPVKQLS